MSSTLLDVTFLKPTTINGRKPYTKYEIHVTSSYHNLSWIVFKRYSDFQTLNDELLSLIDSSHKLQTQGIILGSLPCKRLFGGLNDDVVSDRKHKLQLYTKQCLKYKSLCHQELILEFLNVPEEVKLMISTVVTNTDNDRNKDHNSTGKHLPYPINITDKNANINQQQVNTLLNKLYYQKNRSFAIKNFEKWYFEQSFGKKFNPHLIRKLLIGQDKYIGLIQASKHILYKPSPKNALSLLVKLFDIERNKYARLFIQVFINLKSDIYREMDLHRHISDGTANDAFQILSIFNHYLPHLHYRIYVNSDEGYHQFLKWNEIQSNSYIVGSYLMLDKEKMEEKQMSTSVFDYNLYKNHPTCLITLSEVIFTRYCALRDENDDGYRVIHKINEKYDAISLDVRVQKDFYNDHWKIKISFVSEFDAVTVYKFLRLSYVGNNDNYGWDKKLIDRKIEEELTENQYIMHETFKSYNSPYRFRDFVVLRTFLEKNKTFFAICSSITNYNNLCESDKGATRCIMFPSGFQISPFGDGKSCIIYRLHLTEEGINIINADLLGECDELFQSLMQIDPLITSNLHQKQQIQS